MSYLVKYGGDDVNIVLYNTSSDRRRVNKSLQEVVTISDVSLKEDTSLLNPSFVLTKSKVLTFDFNYLYCEYFKRYYYCDAPILRAGGIIEIPCHVDVLMSFRDDILNHNAYVMRQEKKFFETSKMQSKNGIFYDGDYPIRSDCFIKIIDVGEVCDDSSYYLTVNGGVQ